MKWFEGAAAMAVVQHGLCTRAQLLALGVSRHQLADGLASGVLVRVQPRVYAIGGTPSTPQRDVLAACLSVGGFAACRSGGRLWGVPIPGPVRPEVVVVGPAPQRLRGVIVHRSNRLDRGDRTVIDGIPVTSLPRTILDLGAVLRPWEVELAMEDAVLRLGTSIRSLRACLDRVATNGRRGAGVLRAILDWRDPALAPTESALNLALDRVLRRQNVPPWVREHWVTDDVRLDVAWPHAKLGIEADSRRWHAGRFDVERNARKANVLTALGWSVYHYSWVDVRYRPATIGDDVRGFLARCAA